MSSNKIIVDEALISTDVDRLIKTIAEEKKVTLIDLVQLCTMDKKTIEKWVRVLEDEGYVEMKYKLGATHIIWKGGEVETAEEVPVKEDAPAEQQSSAAIPESAYPEPPIARPTVQINEPIDDIKTSILTKLEAQEAEEIASATALDFKKEAETIAQMEELPASIEDTPSIQEIPKNQEQTEIDEKGPEVDDEKPPGGETWTVESVEPESITRNTKGSTISEIREKNEEKAKSPKLISPQTRELLTSYIQEVNREKETISELKRERERLYREKFSTLQGKMESDIAALTELIIDKQTKIADLKEHFLELPDKVSELEEAQTRMEKLREESTTALEGLRTKSKTILTDLDTSRKEIGGKIEEMDVSMRKNEEKLLHLERIGESVDNRIRGARSKIQEVNDQIEELGSLVKGLVGEIAQTRDIKEELKEQADEIKNSLAEQSAEIITLTNELGAMENIEMRIRKYLGEYQDEVSKIEDYVEKSEDEMAELRESAETQYLRRYLGELENITEAYESELDDAVSTEAAIEEKIASAKARIMENVRSSQTIIKKLRAQTTESRDFDSMKDKLMEKTNQIREIVDGKGEERDEIDEETEKLPKYAMSKSLKPKLKKKEAETKKRK